MVDENGTHPEPEAVLPPPPIQPTPSAPAAPPHLAPPVMPPVPVPPAPGYGGHAFPQDTPLPPPPPASTSSNGLGIVLAIIGGLVVLAVVAIAVIVGVLTGIRNDSASPIAPLPTAPADSSEDSPSDAPADQAPADTSDITAQLEAKIEEYKGLRDSGELWQTIPDTEFNRVAVVAFLYFLTDMRIATDFGVDADTAQEYAEEMAMLEERLLAEEPLGSDIEIVFSEDRVFRYNGDTGEGGYSEE